MRFKYHDKPDISFVDFSSMVVMQDLGIMEVFTGDAHFRRVDLGFQAPVRNEGTLFDTFSRTIYLLCSFSLLTSSHLPTRNDRMPRQRCRP
jgi:hypothetical protein